ncbi:MAG: hypothetical protein ACOX25_05265 [Caldicoprobacterales bacterium]
MSKAVFPFVFPLPLMYHKTDRSINQRKGVDRFDSVGKVVCPLADRDGGGAPPLSFCLLTAG